MTSFSERLSNLLVPQGATYEKVVDLFAGCGGLSLGFEAAGFATHGFEMVSSAVQTYRRNLNGPCEEVKLRSVLNTQPPMSSLADLLASRSVSEENNRA